MVSIKDNKLLGRFVWNKMLAAPKQWVKRQIEKLGVKQSNILKESFTNVFLKQSIMQGFI